MVPELQIWLGGACSREVLHGLHYKPHQFVFWHQQNLQKEKQREKNENPKFKRETMDQSAGFEAKEANEVHESKPQ